MNRIASKNQKIKKKDNEKKHRKKKKKHFGRIIFLMILIILIFAGATFAVKTIENGGGLQGILSTLLGHNAETVKELETIYVLVMGVSEDLDSKLTDTIILCAYNPQEQTASMLSIPRDTFVGTSLTKAKGTDKINALYSTSPEKTMSAVSEITGIDINYYAVINTTALIEIVDIIGGVEYDVPINMVYDDETQNLHINLKAGMQLIDGEKAEQLLRFRHSNADSNGNMTTYSSEYGTDDYGRMRTQRDFIIETVKQVLQFKNITKIKSIITTVFDNIETNIDINTVLDYLPYAVNIDTNNIESEQLPGVSDKYNSIWFFIYDEDETEELIETMQNNLNNIVIEESDENTISNTLNETNTTNSSNTSKSTNTTNTAKKSNSTNTSK